MHDEDEICYVVIHMRQLINGNNSVNLYDTMRGNSKSGYFKMQTYTEGKSNDM